jgi:MFS family permease
MAETYTAHNLRVILILTLGSLTFGYSYSVISGTLGQPGFLEYFNLGTDQARARIITGTINGLVCAGAVFGSLNVGWMCEAYGRKKTLYLTCAINIFGEALQAGSINLGMFLAARFIGGWGIGMAVVLVPLYQAEICELHAIMPPPN